MLHLLVPFLLALPEPQPAELRREALMDALKSGGYTVILRHARTDRSFNEVRDPVPTLRAEQRNLNDDGIRDAALMGVVLRRYEIRFAEVISSPMYRCVETAEMAYAKPTSTTMALRIFPSTADQAALVAQAPAPGTNRLLVTHHFVIETHVPGIRPGEIGESEAVVVKSVGGKVELVGRILLDDWRALANPGGAKAAEAPQQAHTPNAQTPDANRRTLVASASFPDTHAGHMARLYFDAFNSGNRETMKKFIESSMITSPDRPIEQRLDTYMKLFADYGILAVHLVEKTESTEVVLGVQSKAGQMRVTVSTLPEDPMRVKSVTFASYQQGTHR
jgi:phosphohistidine phosphatase SixA